MAGERGHRVHAEELAALGDEVKAEAEEAVAYAEKAPYPDGSEVDMHVYTDRAHALA